MSWFLFKTHLWVYTEKVGACWNTQTFKCHCKEAFWHKIEVSGWFWVSTAAAMWCWRIEENKLPNRVFIHNLRVNTTFVHVMHFPVKCPIFLRVATPTSLVRNFISPHHKYPYNKMIVRTTGNLEGLGLEKYSHKCRVFLERTLEPLSWTMLSKVEYPKTRRGLCAFWVKSLLRLDNFCCHLATYMFRLYRPNAI